MQDQSACAPNACSMILSVLAIFWLEDHEDLQEVFSFDAKFCLHDTWRCITYMCLFRHSFHSLCRHHTNDQ